MNHVVSIFVFYETKNYEKYKSLKKKCIPYHFTVQDYQMGGKNAMEKRAWITGRGSSGNHVDLNY